MCPGKLLSLGLRNFSCQMGITMPVTWGCSKIKLLFSVAQSCPAFCNPMDCSLPAPLSMEFFRQEYWSRLPFPPPEDPLNPGIDPMSPALAGGLFITVAPGKH